MSYAKLISEALTNSSNGRLTVSDIYKAISIKHPYFKMETRGWKNCIKHNLSINKSFIKSEKKVKNGPKLKNCPQSVLKLALSGSKFLAPLIGGPPQRLWQLTKLGVVL